MGSLIIESDALTLNLILILIKDLVVFFLIL